MRILVIGFLAFSIWSAFSTFVYVCKIKGLCYESTPMEVDTVNRADLFAADTLSKPQIPDQVKRPNDLVFYFAFDKSEFNTDAESEKSVNESKIYLDKNAQSILSITGYTDAVGSDEYNQALGYRRAQSVQHYFESKGMAVNRITIESKGEKEPADNNITEAGCANNRRTVITIKK